MILSIDESIQKLKMEILAQDWRLPRKRIEPLEAAFACLKQRFKTRKNIHALLTMADSVLQYLKKKQDKSPEFIDFLKEAMAHIVNMYEENKFDPERDEELFKRMYTRFARLKQKVREEKQVPEPGRAAHPHPPSGPENRPAAKGSPEFAAPRPPAAATALSAPPPASPARLSADDPPAGAVPLKKAAPPRPANKPAPCPQDRKGYTPFPETELREIIINGITVGIEEKHIALIQALPAKKKRDYLKSSQIPAKDFRKFMRGLSGQFKGNLATIKGSKLKKLVFPLLVPRGMKLPGVPDEKAAQIIVISSGQWHGAIMCSAVNGATKNLARFQKAKNGDIAGFGVLPDESRVPLLDPETILKREGFLSVVDPNFLNNV